jgi:signal peptidase II
VQPVTNAVSTTPSRAAKLGICLAATVLVLDQVTKWWIVNLVMQPPQSIEVTSFFQIVMVWNPGISFGLFSDAGMIGRWALPALAVIISVALSVWLWRVQDRLTAIALGLIIGGAVGNLIDRLVYDGAVADFLLFHIGSYAWPAFNVADSAISVGAVALVVESLFGNADRNKNQRSLDSQRADDP